MNVFFHRNHTNKKIEIESFMLYFTINGIVYIFFSSPLIIFALNLLVFFMFTYKYPGKLSTRLISTALIYSVNICVYGIVYNLMKTVDTIGDVTIITEIIANLLLFLFVLVFENVL